MKLCEKIKSLFGWKSSQLMSITYFYGGKSRLWFTFRGHKPKKGWESQFRSVSTISYSSSNADLSLVDFKISEKMLQDLTLWHHRFMFQLCLFTKPLNLTSNSVKTKVALYLHSALIHVEASAADRGRLCFTAALFWRRMWFVVDKPLPVTSTDGSWDNTFSVE